MAEVTCCGALEELSEEYGWPLYRPIKMNKKNHQLEPGNWCIQVFYKTPSGGISKKNTPAYRLNYCPFCGQKLGKEGEDE